MVAVLGNYFVPQPLCTATADSELQMAQKVGRRALSFEDFMTAVEAMVSLHGALAQQQVKRLPSE